MRWIVPRSLPVVLAGVCMLAAGCGDDGDAKSSSDGGSEVADAAAAEKFVNEAGKLLGQARGPSYCKRLEPINERATSRLACPAPPALRKSLATFETTGAGSYGTGAVVDYTSGGARDGASVLLAQGTDGRWMLTKFGLVYGKTVGTDDGPSRKAFDHAVATYLRAIRTRDCKLYYQLSIIQASNPKKACDPGGGYDQTKTVARALRESGNPEPDYLGGNSAFGFYGLALSRPKRRYDTITVVRAASDSGPAAGILNFTPGPLDTKAP